MQCSILDHAASIGRHFDSEGYPVGVEPRGDDTPVQGSHSHKKRWSHYFNAIENTLPRLISFISFPPNNLFRRTHLQAVLEEEISTARHAHRYLHYHRGYYFPLFGNDFSSCQKFKIYGLGEDEKQAQQDEDEQALRELLNKIQQRNSIRA